MSQDHAELCPSGSLPHCSLLLICRMLLPVHLWPIQRPCVNADPCTELCSARSAACCAQHATICRPNYSEQTTQLANKHASKLPYYGQTTPGQFGKDMQIICKSNLPHKAPGSASLVGIVSVFVTVPQKPVRGAHQPDSTDAAAPTRPLLRLFDTGKSLGIPPCNSQKHACLHTHAWYVRSNWTYAAHATTGTSCETARQAASPKPTEAPMLWAAVATTGPPPTGKRSVPESKCTPHLTSVDTHTQA